MSAEVSPASSRTQHPAAAFVPSLTEYEPGDGSWELPSELRVTHDPGAESGAQLLAGYLAITGKHVTIEATPAEGDIALRLDPAHESAPGMAPGQEEGYALDVTADGARLRSASIAGLRHAVQTLRQLLPPQIYASTPAPDPAQIAWRLPLVHIVDAPRFSWRGSLLDVGRWHLPLAYLHRYVEVLAIHKLNRLHLHLTEDQGWRFDVRRYPDLTRVGAWRAQSPAGHAREGRWDGVPHGGFYTQDELRELVAFAGLRGVVIVPEIDLPGHVTAALAAYPQLGNEATPAPGGSPANASEAVAVSTNWGVHERVLNVEDSTVQFCRDVLDEVMDVFPSRWVHLGGDECPTTEWATSPRAVKRARELGLSGVEQLQGWFLAQLCAHLRARGRTPVVWDEAFTSALPADAVVMAWRNEEVGFAAAAAGHEVVMAPEQHTYFDHYQQDPARSPGEPLAIGGLTTLDDVIAYDPMPPRTLDDASATRVLGTQGQLWTEYLPTPERVDDMAYPRLSALAEHAWSTRRAPEDDVRARLVVHAVRLEHAGVHARPIT